MKRGKFVASVRKFCSLLVFCICVFTAGYCVGMRGSINRFLGGARTQPSASTATQSAKKGTYSAILSGKWIYVYNETGTLCNAVYVYTDNMTEDDKSALSEGVEFKSEAEMLSFLEKFG